jgi:hypothetical protein
VPIVNDYVPETHTPAAAAAAAADVDNEQSCE